MHRISFFDRIETVLIQTLFEHLSDQRSDLIFVEVGAFDGKTGSHTHSLAVERGWSGVVVEPGPTAFLALEQTYRGRPSILPLNCAVSDQEGVLPFYWVRNSRPDSWEGMLSSLDKDTILNQRQLIPEIETLIVEKKVEVRTLARICRDAGLDRVDLLKIDAEGHDDAVVRSLDFSRLRPSLILMEHKLIDNDRLFKLQNMLSKYNYGCLAMWANTIFVGPDFAEDECVARLLRHASAMFPPGRDKEWGNGGWYVHDRGSIISRVWRR
jgi:FkbM family methyltransferase